MSRAEKVELCLIVLFLLMVFFAGELPDKSIKLSPAILYSAVLLFCQGLFRDLWYMFVIRRSKRLNNKSKKQLLTKPAIVKSPIVKQCMCVESTIGVLAVTVGLLLLSTKIDARIPFSQLILLIVVSAVLFGGFLIKDYVIEWNPWRLYKEKDHMNVIFSFNKPD